MFSKQDGKLPKEMDFSLSHKTLKEMNESAARNKKE